MSARRQGDSIGSGSIAIPEIELGAAIPKILHRIYAYESPMPDRLLAAVDSLKSANPTWEHRLYDMPAMTSFIDQHYGSEVLERFCRINPVYGAARADLFRYLAVYRLGGVYLDIKSTFTRPLDEVLKGDEGFIISHWDNGPADEHATWGLHDALAHMPHGEIQQWHVVSVAGHPYLRRTIINLLHRIERYRPGRDPVGWLGVLHLTGPVAYTLDIAPIMAVHPHTKLRDHRDLCLRYSIFVKDEHQKLSTVHYVNSNAPLVNPRGIAGNVLSAVWRLLRWLCWHARKWKRRMADGGTGTSLKPPE